MTLVYTDPQVVGPGTHALVIGVGKYPALRGGSADRSPNYEGMGQLTSPPHSARAFASWLATSFQNPDRPLAAIRMLLSADDRTFTGPPEPGKDTADIVVDEAVIRNVVTEATAWQQAGLTSPGSLLIFYFCGHGIAVGDELSLVAQDYGQTPRPLEALIDFGGLLRGMSNSSSPDQCYFIDACRVASGKILESANTSGDPLIQTISTDRTARQTVYFSTVGGEKSHGQPGQPSLFTSALLKALDGPAASNNLGQWQVTSTRLLDAITHLMRPEVQPDIPTVQVPASGTQVEMLLHRLPGRPKVPLTVHLPSYKGKNPPKEVSSLAIERIGIEGAVSGWNRRGPAYPSPCEWRKQHFQTWLTVGEYSATLDWKDGRSSKTECFLATPGHILTDFDDA